MKQYEAIAIFSPSVTGLDGKNSFEELVRKNAGTVLKRTEMGKRFLGYPVKKSREGYVVGFDFELQPDKVAELKRLLDLSEDVLKYTIVVKKKNRAAAKLGAAAVKK